jgi:prophage DNA circulation protein
MVPASEVVSADQDLVLNLKNLGIIDQHASALGSYFDTLSKLTGNKLNTSMETSANGLVTAIGTMSSTVKGLTIAGKPVNNYVKSVTDLALTFFKVRALDKHLTTAAPVIDDALMAQQAAIDCIGAVMQSDLKVALENQETTEVIAPYTAPFDFPTPPPCPPVGTLIGKRTCEPRLRSTAWIARRLQ